jgi:hypothetical protein
MTRLDLLLTAYARYDLIYSGLIMLGVWAAGTGHLLDWITQRRGRILVNIYWTLILILYVAGITFIGLQFST